MFCGKKNLPTYDPLGFSRRMLFCLASESFMIFSSTVADGFSIFDFRFSPDPGECFRLLLSCDSEPFIMSVFPVAERFKILSPDLKPSDVRSLNYYPMCITRTEDLAL